MSHYFIADNSLESDIQTFRYFYKDLEFFFTTNAGMFSQGHVDPASDLLIRTLPPLKGSLLDLGCGYGPIGIVLGTVHNISVTMTDVNGRALEYAKINCEQNKFTAELIESYSFNEIDGSFDSITLNPPIHAGKQLIFLMYEASYEHLNLGGRLYIVIQEKHGAKSTIKKLNEIFGQCDIIYKKKGTYIIAATK